MLFPLIKRYILEFCACLIDNNDDWAVPKKETVGKQDWFRKEEDAENKHRKC